MPSVPFAALVPFLLPGMVVALLLSIISIVFLYREHERINKLLIGKNGGSLEDAIIALGVRTQDIESFRSELGVYLKRAESRIQTSIRGVACIRFNPFKGEGSGGDQSSATALVSEEGNGFVLSVLYSRDRVSVFTKPLVKGISAYELSEEEKEALRLAQAQTRG